jgi:hypothetical protein
MDVSIGFWRINNPHPIFWGQTFPVEEFFSNW